MSRLLFSLLLASTSLGGCGSAPAVVRTDPGGEPVRLLLASGAQFNGELLAVNPDALFLAGSRGGMFEVPLADVRSVVVGRFQATEKRLALLVVGTATAVLGLALWNDPEDDFKQFGRVSFLLGAGGLYKAAQQPGRFRAPLDAAAVNRLRLHSRYPQGLTELQWQALLAGSGQEGFRAVGG